MVVNGNMCAEGDVYAAGDIARFPLPLISDSTSIGHWQLAHNHGDDLEGGRREGGREGGRKEGGREGGEREGGREGGKKEEREREGREDERKSITNAGTCRCDYVRIMYEVLIGSQLGECEKTGVEHYMYIFHVHVRNRGQRMEDNSISCTHSIYICIIISLMRGFYPFSGRVAARNMMGREETFSSIPFFWTVLFGKSLRYCGEHQCVCVE